jgi:hypothetical protein
MSTPVLSSTPRSIEQETIHLAEIKTLIDADQMKSMSLGYCRVCICLSIARCTGVAIVVAPPEDGGSHIPMSSEPPCRSASGALVTTFTSLSRCFRECLINVDRPFELPPASWSSTTWLLGNSRKVRTPARASDSQVSAGVYGNWISAAVCNNPASCRGDNHISLYDSHVPRDSR